MGHLYNATRIKLIRIYLGFGFLIALCAGCVPAGLGSGEGEILTWGRRGLGDTQFQKPRAIVVGPDQQLFIIDMTARIQVFDTDGTFIKSWKTPEYKVGKPCGLTISHDGLLMVADTHYYRILFYTMDGEPVEERTLGGVNGTGQGEFGFVTDVVQDSKGNYYVSEYGEYDRIQKFDPDGNFVYEWGGHGSEKGQFLRPQGLVMDDQDQLWVADAANHRIQIFDVTGDKPEFVKTWGDPGKGYGQLNYPYDLCFDGQGNILVCELGSHRIQRFTLDGKVLGAWGEAGREPGQLHQPWSMSLDDQGRIHVLDTYNHRVQRFHQSAIKPPRD